MSTTTTQQQILAERQILAEWDKCKKRLLPAVLSDTLACGQMVNGHMQTKGLPYTEAGFYQAIKDLMRQLPWDKKPAALIAIEKADAPAPLDNPRILEEERHKKIKAEEDAKAKQKVETQIWKDIDFAILSYDPINRNGRRMLGKKEEVQNRLRQYVAEQKARNAEPKSILQEVANYVLKKQTEDQQAVERL